MEADVEILTLARERCLEAAGVTDFTTDVADVRIVRRLLDGVEVAPALLRDLHGALARKDGAEIGRLTRAFPESRREGLRALPHLFGDIEVLKEAEQLLVWYLVSLVCSVS